MSESIRVRDKRIIGICGNGNFTDLEPGLVEECMCCGREFTTHEIVVELFEYDVVCPDCILSGPKKMAQLIREERIPLEEKGPTIPFLMRIATILERKESITEFPGGIFALKIAEAYRAIEEGKAA